MSPMRGTLIGVVHLLALPGAPRYRGSLQRVVDRARADAEAYLTGGMDGLIVENLGDAPFFPSVVPAETVAALTRVACAVRELGDFPLGINVLRADTHAALAVALASGAQFIRANVLAGVMVTDQGLIQGRAAQLMRLRSALRAKIEIWADCLVKHAQPLVPTDVVSNALDLVERALADAVILTGPRTGTPVDREQLMAVKRALPRTRCVAGSGVTAANLPRLWGSADAFLVGTALERRGRTGARVETERVRELVGARQRLVARRKP